MNGLKDQHRLLALTPTQHSFSMTLYFVLPQILVIEYFYLKKLTAKSKDLPKFVYKCNMPWRNM